MIEGSGFRTKGEGSMKDRSKPRILVVDDWHDIADSMAGLLNIWGYDT
jgi:CheY-like chemotaxis protein